MDEEGKKVNWNASVVHAYDCTNSKATGYYPFYFLFGRKPWFSLSLSKAQCPCEEYVRAWTTWKVMLILGRSNTYSGLLNGGK